MPTISIEVYDGTWTRMYWSDNAQCNICKKNGYIFIYGNKSFFNTVATQMIYFAVNDSLLPSGTHVHYDESFGRKYMGPEFVLEVIPSMDRTIDLDSTDPLTISIALPGDISKLNDYWHNKAMVAVTDDSDIHLLANYHGLLFIATALLFLVENGEIEMSICCDNQLYSGWSGTGIVFCIS